MDKRNIKLVFFAQLKETLGDFTIVSIESINVEELKSELLRLFPNVILLQNSKLASNSKILIDNEDITNLKEIYIIPPTSGG